MSDAAWWQIGALGVAMVAAAALYFGRGRLPWWAAGLGGALVAFGGLVALFWRKAPNSPAVGSEREGLDVGASKAQETKQRPNEALEEIEYEASKLGLDDDVAVERLDSGGDELAEWRAGAERDGF